MIKVYEPTETQFNDNGLGTVEVLKGIESKAIGLNGWSYEATVKASYSDLIQQDNIVLVDTKEHHGQPFRIRSIRRENRKITFKADHVIFDAARYVLGDVRPTNLGAIEYLTYCNARTDETSPFTVGGDYTGPAGTNYFIRKTLLDALDQAQKTFGCIIDPYNFMIRAMKPSSVGSDNGFTVSYGRNLQGVTIDEDWTQVCTKLMPVGPDGLLLDDPFLTADVSYDQPYTVVKSFSFDKGEMTEAQQKEKLQELGEAYLDEHKYPKISYTVKSDVPQDLAVNDVIRIKHPLVTLTANVTGYTYDPESHRVKSLTFGNYVPNTATALQERISEAAADAAGTFVDATISSYITPYDAAMMELGTVIANGMGMFITREPKPNGGYQIYYHDKPDLSDSNVVYTINNGAFAVSTDGGITWNAGITPQGDAVLNSLAVIGLSAGWIETGILEVKKGTQEVLYVDVDTGTVRIVADSFSVWSGNNVQTLEQFVDGEISEHAYDDTDVRTLIQQNRAQIQLKAEASTVQAHYNELTGRIDELPASWRSDITVTADEISATVAALTTRVDENGDAIEDLQYTKTYVKEDGLYVEDSEHDSKTRITGAGLNVLGKTNDEVLLQADTDGVTAKQLTTRTSFKVATDQLNLDLRQWYSATDSEYAIAFFVTDAA
jgi:phage minor structural protein